MSLLAPLFQYSQQNPQLSVSEVFNHVNNQPVQLSQFQPQHPNHPFNNPNMQPSQPNQFVSPAPPHLSLPMNVQSNGTSPNTLQNFSPAMSHQMLQGQMHGTPQQSNQHLGQGPASVTMVNQQSQQGTNTSGGGSQGPSAHASPNFTNKRRRASGVKVEGEDAPEVNGTVPAGQNKVKASPRVTQKRQKGNG